MKKLLCSAAVLSIALAPATSPAQQEVDFADLLDIDVLTRVMLDVGVMMLRSQVDMTYEGISVSRGGREISLVGLRFYPFDWSPDLPCEVAVARLDISSSGGIGASATHIEAVGTEIAEGCLEPEMREPLMMTGYESLAVERLYVDIAYDVGSSALDASGHLSLRDAVVVDASATFDYFWFRDTGYGDPEPAMLLSSVTVSIEDRGLLDRLRPAIPPEAFDFDAAPQIVQGGLQDALGMGGTRPLSDEAAAFARAAGEAVGEFLGGAGRLTVSSRPDQPIWLGPNTFQVPSDMIDLLQPRIGAGTAMLSERMVDVDLIATAMQGGALPDADRRAVGLALLDGVGAPLAPDLGRDLLDGLGDADGSVALAVARSLAADDPSGAYSHALRAGAAGAEGALALLDALEAGLDAGDIIALQGSHRGGAIEAAGNASDLRDAALAAMLGIGGTRSYADAYVLASLAAAAGDPSSAGLRDRVGRRMQGHDETGDWAALVPALNGEVLELWVGTLAARFDSGGGGSNTGGWGRSNN